MEHKSENVFICPRCKQVLPSSASTCINCGYDLNAKVEETELLFGLDTPTTAITAEESSSIAYMQDPTESIQKFKTIQYISIFVISILSVLFFLLPLFSKTNIWDYVQNAKDQYQFQVNDCLAFSNKTMLYGLVRNLVTYLKSNKLLDGVNTGLIYYQFGVSVCVLGIITSGVILLVQSIKALFLHKQIVRFRGVLGAILVFAMMLVFGFGCYGVGPLLLSILVFLTFLYFYISDIISKEKKLVVKHLIIKGISFILLLVLLSLSSIGYVRINVVTGANLYGLDAVVMPDENGNVLKEIVGLKGFMLEFVQTAQADGGDESFRTLAHTFLRIGGSLHVVYLTLLITAIVSILRSMSNQSVKFPVYMTSYAIIAFVGFIVFLVLFNNIVNEAMLQKYIDAIGNYEYEIKTAAEKENLKQQYKVFTISNGLNASIIMSIPTIVLSIISRNILLNRNY